MKRCGWLVCFLLCLCAANLSAQAVPVLVTAKFSYDDQSPVAGSVKLFRVGTPDTLLGNFTLDAQGRVNATLSLDPSAQYSGQLIAADGKTIILAAQTVSLGAAAGALVLNTLPTGEINFVLSKASPAFDSTRISFAPFATTVNFTNPAPFSNPLNGTYKGLNFGTSGQWEWQQGPWVGCSENSAYIWPGGNISRPFSFVAPHVLTGMKLCTEQGGILTLTSDQGETFSQVLTSGQVVTVTPAWTKPATVITVGFTRGWEMAIEEISYK